MSQTILSKRLNRVAQYVKWLQAELDPIYLADIGSDHAYLPIYLLQKGLISHAIAGEVVEGPYQSAIENVNLASLAPQQVSVRLGDGLSVVQPDDQVNLVTICGMGGQLIVRILDEGYRRLKPYHSLILQPNVGEASLRRWLNQHGYYIVAEDLIAESGHTYEIIVAQHRPDQPAQPLSQSDLLLGPYLSMNPSKEVIDKWHHQFKYRQQLIHSMNQAKQPDLERIKQLELELTFIKEGLDIHDQNH